MTKNKFLDILVKNKVKPSSERNLTLFTMSCISLGYASRLQNIIGFNYSILSAVGHDDHLITLQNDIDTVRKTSFFIKKNKSELNNFFDNLFENVSDLKKEYSGLNKIKNGEEFLFKLVDYYPRYTAVLGVYNCFWRYSQLVSRLVIDKNIICQVRDGRDVIASFYPQIEEKFKRSCDNVGKKFGFDGSLLRSATRDEIIKFLTSYKLSRIFLNELSKRRKQYVYLYNKGQDYIFSDVKFYDKIYKKFIMADKSIKTIKGEVAYKGNIRGLVYNNTKVDVHPEKDFILVTPMTHPSDIDLLKKSLAFVTDEGGILSHASIISRELKKPCIIGTKIATKVFKDGDMVEVDANNGIIKKL